MGIFSKFESHVEDTFEGAANKIFESPISPVQIAKRAEKEMRREKLVGAGRQYAPTLYTVLVNPDDDQRLLGYYPTLAGETETYLAAKAASEGLVMDGQPLVRFVVDRALKRGKIDVVAELVAAPIVDQLRQEEMDRYGIGGKAKRRDGAHGPVPPQRRPQNPAVPPQANPHQAQNDGHGRGDPHDDDPYDNDVFDEYDDAYAGVEARDSAYNPHDAYDDFDEFYDQSPFPSSPPAPSAQEGEGSPADGHGGQVLGGPDEAESPQGRLATLPEIFAPAPPAHPVDPRLSNLPLIEPDRKEDAPGVDVAGARAVDMPDAAGARDDDVFDAAVEDAFDGLAASDVVDVFDEAEIPDVVGAADTLDAPDVADAAHTFTVPDVADAAHTFTVPDVADAVDAFEDPDVVDVFEGDDAVDVFDETKVSDVVGPMALIDPVDEFGDAFDDDFAEVVIPQVIGAPRAAMNLEALDAPDEYDQASFNGPSPYPEDTIDVPAEEAPEQAQQSDSYPDQAQQGDPHLEQAQQGDLHLDHRLYQEPLPQPGQSLHGGTPGQEQAVTLEANPSNTFLMRASLLNASDNRRYDLASPQLFLGRDSSNDIVVDDANASRTHAEIRFDPHGVWVIADLGSTNGTLVNGEEVAVQDLYDGDYITIGMTNFVFIQE